MATKKFRPQDIVLNTMKTHPRCEFFIFDSKVYYNSKPEQSGAFSANVVTTPGHLSLYEYNIDRQASGSSTNGKAHSFNEFIRPFISKDSAGSSFRSVTSSGGLNEWTTASVGDVLYGQYPMTASISRKYLDVAGHKMAVYDSDNEDTQKIDYYYSPGAPESDKFTDPRIGESARLIPQYPHYWALRNRLDFYGAQSPHFRVTGNLDAHEDSYEWIKDYQTINLISIPSIFFGSKIKPGSVSLKWYYTGSLCGELRDIKHNGELIQVSGGLHAESHNDKVAGVVMYDEGFVLLTGSWELMPDHEIPMTNPSSSDSPKWVYFGAGAGDGVNTGTAGANFVSCSFNLSFEGVNKTQVMTMFTHARKGEVNYSNNPTFLLYGQQKLKLTSSNIYEENPDQLLANVASSSFTGHSASFERQVYISRVAIYDESKNLIGIATLSNPVLKKEDQDYTFKLKLDI
tara:strand:- start:447 stop:1820 length:1374 start_codon:yes stop_codon:yes gene_type:complete